MYYYYTPNYITRHPKITYTKKLNHVDIKQFYKGSTMMVLKGPTMMTLKAVQKFPQ